MRNRAEYTNRGVYRPTEEAAIQGEAIDRIQLFVDALTIREFAVIAAISTGLSQTQVAAGFGISKTVVHKRVRKARQVAENVFGSEALQDRTPRRDHGDKTFVIFEKQTSNT